jgi:adenylate kinase family enzyme
MVQGRLHPFVTWWAGCRDSITVIVLNMASRRIHITGASGSGVTTIGQALASASGLPHHDTDDYFWQPTEPPYREMRPTKDRLRLMHEMFVPRAGWILSGSLVGWAQELETIFDLVVFVSTPTPIRLERLRRREELRYGAGATALGGRKYEDTRAFFEWAANYDDPSFNGRSRVQHEAWLQTLKCKTIRIDGTRGIGELVDKIMILTEE